MCPFPSCGKDLALGSLQSHYRTQHGMDVCGSILTEPQALAPRSYKLSFKHQSGYSRRVPCPVEGCRYKTATAANFRRHFFNRHYTHRLHLEEDGSVPSYCRACGISVSLHSLQCGHMGGKQCKANIRQNQQRERNEAAAGAQARAFTIDGTVLKKVENFKYLGRQISSRDSDAPALFMNLAKARKRFARLSKLLCREGADSHVGGQIYVAAILAVLLYGSESWVWTSSMMNTIRGFHHRACRRLADKKPIRRQNGTYLYFSADKAMKICKLSPIQVYIARRRQTVLAHVVKRPIYKLCRRTVRSVGTPTRTKFWWEQDLSHWIELEKDDCPEARMIRNAGV